MKAFSTKPIDAGKDVDFELDGDTYTFTPPKTSTSIVAMMQVKGDSMEANLQRVQAMFTWLGQGLNREHEPKKGRKPQPGHDEYVDGCQACLIQSRLEDPDDDLDVDTVMETITWLMGEVSGRPTT
jgi:hypothetical protein